MLVMGIRQTVGEVHSLEQTPKSVFAWANVNSIGGSVESLSGSSVLGEKSQEPCSC